MFVWAGFRRWSKQEAHETGLKTGGQAGREPGAKCSEGIYSSVRIHFARPQRSIYTLSYTPYSFLRLFELKGARPARQSSQVQACVVARQAASPRWLSKVQVVVEGVLLGAASLLVTNLLPHLPVAYGALAGEPKLLPKIEPGGGREDLRLLFDAIARRFAPGGGVGTGT